MSSSSSTGKSLRDKANDVINFTGLGSSKGSGNQPSFRFSPENEEIQEVPSLHSINSVAENNSEGEQEPVTPQSESVPASPKPGETSPIKEYIRKNWTNKWDKKALSLDLDLRGKIKTAIEDKRKSLVSHFISEETGLPLPPSSTASKIPEHTAVSVSTASSEPSSTSATNSNSRVFTFDSSTQKVSSHVPQADMASVAVVGGPPDDLVEVGVDPVPNMERQELLEEQLQAEDIDMSILSWKCSPSSIAEAFEGVLTSVETEDASKEVSVEPNEFKPLSYIFKNFMRKILRHFLMKYLLALFAAAIILPTAFIAFLCGVLCTIMVSSAFSEIWNNAEEFRASAQESKALQEDSRPSSPHSSTGNLAKEHRIFSVNLSPKSQSWMLLYTGDYNPEVVNFHHADPVFVRLEGSYLYISTPSPKFRIPRRKLWNDPPLNHDIKFVKHVVYNIGEAEFFIAPERLAKRRVWNKKYPIGVRFPNSSFEWTVTRFRDPLTPADSKSTTSDTSSLNSLKEENSGVTARIKQKSLMSLVKGDKELLRKDCKDKVFYLFSRTCREKDDWFRRFTSASRDKCTIPSGDSPIPNLQLEYLKYMRNIIPDYVNSLRDGSEGDGKKENKMKSSTSLESEDSIGSRNSPEILEVESNLNWLDSPTFLNAFLGRLFFDALRSPHWSLQLQNRIQRKLNFLKRPAFVELLIAKDLELGGCCPIIQRASSPVIDTRGLWVDLDFNYEGNFCLTLEAKVNLLKLKLPSRPTEEDTPQNDGDDEEDEDTSATSVGIDGVPLPVRNLYDSEADDSGESSEEEIEKESFYLRDEAADSADDSASDSSDYAPPAPGPAHQSKGAKFLKIVEKVATSNFVSEMKVVKSAIGKVRKTPLLLTVEVKEFSGTLCLNIPSPPSDRIWIGFRKKPHMKLVTTPKVGVRSVNLNPVTDWIKRKIHQQIQRVLVLPNMDDTMIKLMDFKIPE